MYADDMYASIYMYTYIGLTDLFMSYLFIFMEYTDINIYMYTGMCVVCLDDPSKTPTRLSSCLRCRTSLASSGPAAAVPAAPWPLAGLAGRSYRRQASMAVYIRACIYTHVYIYIFIYVCMYVCIHACVYVCMHVCMYVSIFHACLCTYMCMDSYIYIYT